MSRRDLPKFFIRDTAGAMYLDLFIAVIPLLLMACFSFGARVLVLTAVAVACAAAGQILCELLMKKRPALCPTTVLTGFFIAFLSPVTAPYWLVAFGSVFAIAVVKMPFGGLGRNPFNPAAAGWCAMVLCAPDRMFNYPSFQYGLDTPLWNSSEFIKEPSVTALLREGSTPNATIFEILLGRITGPMGTVAILLLFACGVYLIIRGTIRWQIPVTFLAVCGLFALLCPRLPDARLWSAATELTAGSLFFCSIFMLTDPVTSPKKPAALVLYGVIAGVFTMLLRYFGAFEQGAPFAILIANAAAPGLDRLIYRLQKGGFAIGRQTAKG